MLLPASSCIIAGNSGWLVAVRNQIRSSFPPRDAPHSCWLWRGGQPPPHPRPPQAEHGHFLGRRAAGPEPCRSHSAFPSRRDEDADDDQHHADYRDTLDPLHRTHVTSVWVDPHRVGSGGKAASAGLGLGSSVRRMLNAPAAAGAEGLSAADSRAKKAAVRHSRGIERSDGGSW
jgi:hypothetical protein